MQPDQMVWVLGDDKPHCKYKKMAQVFQMTRGNLQAQWFSRMKESTSLWGFFYEVINLLEDGFSCLFLF